MKILKTGTLVVLLTVGCLQSFAQVQVINSEPNYNKPKLFSDLPQKMDLNVSDMEALFAVRVGNTIKVMATADFPVFGTVVSKSDERDVSVKTTVIRLSNRLGATFTFSRITKEDGSYVYRGRIMSINNGDAFEIINENGQYILLKKDLYDLISE